MEVPHEIQIKYLEHRQRDLENCLISLQEERLEEIQKVGHQLKGNGETFGYPELTIIGKELERAVLQHDLSQIENSLQNFATWVHNHQFS
jgi:HPt (histidine-containing phosphotransfer) domain-containing protein